MTSEQRTAFGIVARFPPPYGGVSVHVQRLVEVLRRENIPVTIYNQSEKKEAGGTSCPVSPAGFLRFLLRVPEKVLHFHTNNIIALAMIGAILRMRRRRSLLTLHGESPQIQLERKPAILQKLLGQGFVQIDHFVCVNAKIADWVQSLGVEQDRISIIPAYLPPAPRELEVERLDQSIRQFIGSHTPIIGSQGWFGGLFKNGEHCHGFDRIGRFVKRLKDDFPNVGMYTIVSGCLDEAHRDRIMEYRRNEQIEQNWMIIEKGICAPALYSKSDLFLRPTASDGDSVSIRECLQSGVPVVASDAVARPEGCRIFTLKDDQCLMREIIATLHDERPQERMPPAEAGRFANELVDVISKVVEEIDPGRTAKSRLRRAGNDYR